MSAAPKLQLVRETWTDELAGKCLRFALVLEAAGRRSDYRERLAQLLLLLLAHECPASGNPRRNWYVPGAVARFGVESICRAWEGFFGEEPRKRDTVRKYLAELEGYGLIARSPGGWTGARNPRHPEQRPQYPRTIWLLRSDREQRWWALVGRARLRAHPSAEHNLTIWRRLFGRWRKEAHALERQAWLPFPEDDQEDVERNTPSSRSELAPDGRGECQLAPPSADGDGTHVGGTAAGPNHGGAADKGFEDPARHLAEVVARTSDPTPVSAALRGVGVFLTGGRSFEVAGDPERLRGAAALLARALLRGDRIWNPSGWLLTRWRENPRREYLAVILQLRAHNNARNGNARANE